MKSLKFLNEGLNLD